MKTSDFYYDLPPQLIAQTPAQPRDSSRLLVYNRANDSVTHAIFRDVVDYLNAGDVLVVNNTKVIPARIYGKKQGTGGKIEFLLLRRIDYSTWEVLVKPGRIAKPGSVFVFDSGLSAEVLSIGDEGCRIVKFTWQGVFEDVLSQIGQMPLPPYIKTALQDGSRYNTVYSKIDGSAAAPTAGLHFTDELLQKIRDKGVKIVEVLLHVGLGTFRPVKETDVENHKMHSEYFCITDQTAQEINSARKKGGKVVAVGTTSVRVLESAVSPDGTVHAASGFTDIFLYPPYKIKSVDALITNFHLPESTLLMLVSCLVPRERLLSIYKEAVEEKYRFFSFGDACLFL